MKLRGIRKLARRLSLRDVAMFGAGAAVVLAGLRIAAVLREPPVPLSPESATITSPWIPDTVKRWHGPVETMAKRYDVDPNLVAIIMTMESGGYSKANSGQAEGLMQIAPATAGDIAKRYVKQPVDKYDIWDPQTNIEFGTAYLAKLRDIYGTESQGPAWIYTAELVAAAYNGGFGAANSVEKGEGLGDPQTIAYSRDVFNMWRERHAAKSPTFERWKERGGSRLIDQARAEAQN